MADLSHPPPLYNFGDPAQSMMEGLAVAEGVIRARQMGNQIKLQGLQLTHAMRQSELEGTEIDFQRRNLPLIQEVQRKQLEANNAQFQAELADQGLLLDAAKQGRDVPSSSLSSFKYRALQEQREIQKQRAEDWLWRYQTEAELRREKNEIDADRARQHLEFQRQQLQQAKAIADAKLGEEHDYHVSLSKDKAEDRASREKMAETRESGRQQTAGTRDLASLRSTLTRLINAQTLVTPKSTAYKDLDDEIEQVKAEIKVKETGKPIDPTTIGKFKILKVTP